MIWSKSFFFFTRGLRHHHRSVAVMDTTAKWLRARVSECTAQEISGALGDVGLFVTILVALARELQLSIGSTLLFSGFYNVATGVLLAAPVPVQPMKVCVCTCVCVCMCVCVTNADTHIESLSVWQAVV